MSCSLLWRRLLVRSQVWRSDPQKFESFCEIVHLDCDSEDNFIQCETCYKKVCLDCSEEPFIVVFGIAHIAPSAKT